MPSSLPASASCFLVTLMLTTEPQAHVIGEWCPNFRFVETRPDGGIPERAVLLRTTMIIYTNNFSVHYNSSHTVKISTYDTNCHVPSQLPEVPLQILSVKTGHGAHTRWSWLDDPVALCPSELTSPPHRPDARDLQPECR